jgi:hypothetical protein
MYTMFTGPGADNRCGRRIKSADRPGTPAATIPWASTTPSAMLFLLLLGGPRLADEMPDVSVPSMSSTDPVPSHDHRSTYARRRRAKKSTVACSGGLPASLFVLLHVSSILTRPIGKSSSPHHRRLQGFFPLIFEAKPTLITRTPHVNHAFYYLVI